MHSLQEESHARKGRRSDGPVLLHRLVRSLGLQLIDLEQGSEARLRPTFYFDGRRISEPEVLRAFQPLARRIRQDQEAVGHVVTYRRHTPRAQELDRLSISEYLDRVGASGWMKELLEVAYVAEYGLDAAEQSALNLVLPDRDRARHDV